MRAGRILIVDDQPHAVRVIKLALTRQGYEVDTAGDGAEALGKLRLAPFDVVITDLEMPRMPGRILCETITAEFGARKPLILILTGTTEHDARAWVSRLANTEILDKPLSLKRLLARLEDYFEAALVCDGSVA